MYVWEKLFNLSIEKRWREPNHVNIVKKTIFNNILKKEYEEMSGKIPMQPK